MSAKAPVFLYQFAYVPEWRKQEQPQGAPHSAEIVYVFDSWDTTSLRVNGTVQPVHRDMAKRMNSYWVAFATRRQARHAAAWRRTDVELADRSGSEVRQLTAPNDAADGRVVNTQMRCDLPHREVARMVGGTHT